MKRECVHIEIRSNPMQSRCLFLDFRAYVANLTEVAKKDIMPSFETNEDRARFGKGGTNGTSGDFHEF